MSGELEKLFLSGLDEIPGSLSRWEKTSELFTLDTLSFFPSVSGIFYIPFFDLDHFLYRHMPLPININMAATLINTFIPMGELPFWLLEPPNLLDSSLVTYLPCEHFWLALAVSVGSRPYLWWPTVIICCSSLIWFGSWLHDALATPTQFFSTSNMKVFWRINVPPMRISFPLLNFSIPRQY